MQYGKPALSYSDQLAQLLSRGLECPDPARALEWLRRVGYYRRSAYFIPFRVSRSDNFRPGTTLTDIVGLYKFDASLRLLLLQALDRIEIGVRAVITYHMAHDLGPFGYADKANFDPRYDHSGMMKILGKEENKSKEVFVQHYRRKYTSEPYLPVWMATELLTFGVLSKMYSNVRAGIRKKIAQEFGQPQPVFASWLHALAAIRNMCAHHSRLWNRQLAVRPQIPTAWKAAGIPNNRLYAMALVIQSLLAGTSPRSNWRERLKAHFNAHPFVNLTAMEFPANWQNEPPWV